MLDPTRKKERITRVGEFCKKYREDYLRMSLTDFSIETNINIKNLSAFERGNANSIDYLFYYYELGTELDKVVFRNNIFQLAKE